MRNYRCSIDIGAPPVVDICNPVNHSHGFAINIDLKTIAVIYPVILRMNVDASFTDRNPPIGHLKIDDFTTPKAYVLNGGIDNLVFRNETG
jgi:hypothetical protein